MKYFKYSAYDKAGEFYSGVDQCPRFEYLAAKLIQQDLRIKEIVTIGYDEYQQALLANKKLQKLKETREKLYGQLNETNAEIQEKKKTSLLIPIIIESIIIIIILFIIIAILVVHNKI